MKLRELEKTLIFSLFLCYSCNNSHQTIADRKVSTNEFILNNSESYKTEEELLYPISNFESYFTPDRKKYNIKGSVKRITTKVEFLDKDLKAEFENKEGNKANNMIISFMRELDITTFIFQNSVVPVKKHPHFLYFMSFGENGFLTGISAIPRHARSAEFKMNEISEVIYDFKFIRVETDTIVANLEKIEILPNRYISFDNRYYSQLNEYTSLENNVFQHRYYEYFDTLKIDGGKLKNELNALEFILEYLFDDNGTLTTLSYEANDIDQSPYFTIEKPAFILKTEVTASSTLEFQYKENEEIETAMLSQNGDFMYQEKYIYNEGNLSGIERMGKIGQHPINNRSYKSFVTLNSSQDLVLVEYYDLQFGKEIIETHRYDYEYDEMGNWTECTIYIGENLEHPTARLDRQISYY